MSYKTDYGRVLGLGSAKEGVEHWWSARVTSVALIPLTIAFLWVVAPLFGANFAEVQTALQNPLKAILVILFILVTTRHLAEGNQVIIEDYIHSKGLRTFAMLKNTLGVWALGLAAIFAVAKIAFGA
ncbi:MAG: succinate dehydrogenase, hydrophobic membrane anchor protein [Pseudomonadota bacterium]